MEHKSDLVLVWLFQLTAWFVNLNVEKVLEGLAVIKELFAALSFIAAFGFTVWKWNQARKRKKQP